MGRVVDGDGVPLPGATVLEKGTSNGAVTDLEGKFALTVADDAVLRFSFMGYKTQEVSVKGHTFLDIVLEEDAVELDKVVVTALGIEKKEHSLSYQGNGTGDELFVGNWCRRTFSEQPYRV